jgi:hypothetical protein
MAPEEGDVTLAALGLAGLFLVVLGGLMVLYEFWRETRQGRTR